MFRICICLSAVAAFLTLSAPAAALQDWPTRFAQLQQFQSADLSPDGEQIAYISGPTVANRSIVIADTADPDTVLRTIELESITIPRGIREAAPTRSSRTAQVTYLELPDYRRLDAIHWLDDEHLLIRIGYVAQTEDGFYRTFRNLQLIYRIEDAVMVVLPWGVALESTALGHDDSALFVEYTAGGANIFEFEFDGFGWDRHSRIVSEDGPPASFALSRRGRRVATLIGEDGRFRVHSSTSSQRRGIIHREDFSLDREVRFEANNWSRWSGIVERLEGLDETGDFVFFSTTAAAPSEARSPGRRRAIYRMDLEDGVIDGPVFNSDIVDVNSTWTDWRNNRVIGARIQDPIRHDVFVSPTFAQIQAALETAFPGERVSLEDWDADLEVVLFRTGAVGHPETLRLYYPATGAVTELGALYPEIEDSGFSTPGIVEYTTRDGMSQFGYLTLPEGASAAAPAPLIVMPHGGPQSRDDDEYDPLLQSLVHAGYAVFQPQFRGSEGFGLDLQDAGEGQWALAMQNDVYDGMDAALANPAVNGDAACMVGWSYGGYVALQSAVDQTDRFLCTIAIAGVSDIRELMDSATVRANYQRLYWARVIGDWRAWGRDEIGLSPALSAANLTRPLLLLHGSADEIVSIAQSQIFAEAANEAGRGALVSGAAIDGARHQYSAMSVPQRVAILRNVLGFLSTHNPVRPGAQAATPHTSTDPVQTPHEAEGGAAATTSPDENG